MTGLESEIGGLESGIYKRGNRHRSASGETGRGRISFLTPLSSLRKSQKAISPSRQAAKPVASESRYSLLTLLSSPLLSENRKKRFPLLQLDAPKSKMAQAVAGVGTRAGYESGGIGESATA